MKTKVIPFDLDKAKKIRTGEIEGKIITKLGWEVTRIIFNIKHQLYPLLVCFWNPETSQEDAWRYKADGEIECRADEYSSRHLFLEVPDNEPQFKPFDKVLVRGCDGYCSEISDFWTPAYYQRNVGEHIHLVSGLFWKQCIPYEGNEYLVGTTDNPKEE